ncbi:hypothetical protein AYI69_g714 [Smittium culicis]|uniref:BLOC-1-related complex subunit 5 n=1 Tax=Smittium culicis TaxID=133412 RepID=A0A1R1YS91_9FUNG|nr:hypothetical protein AYI69_g714 [Smittium culicis]
MGNKSSKTSSLRQGGVSNIYSESYDETLRNNDDVANIQLSHNASNKTNNTDQSGCKYIHKNFPFETAPVSNSCSNLAYSQFGKREIGQVYQRKIGTNMTHSTSKDSSKSDQYSQNFGKRSTSFLNSSISANKQNSKAENNLVTISKFKQTQIDNDQLVSLDNLGSIKPILEDSNRNRLSDFFFSSSSYLNSISSFSSAYRFVDLKPSINLNDKDLFFIAETLKDSLASELSTIHTTQDGLIKKSLVLSKNFETAHSNVIRINNQAQTELEKLSTINKIGKQAEKTYEYMQEIFHDLERLESLLPPEMQLMEGDTQSQNKHPRLVEAFSVRIYNNSGRKKQIELLHHNVIGKCANYLNQKSKNFEKHNETNNSFTNNLNTSPNYAKFSTISHSNYPTYYENRHPSIGSSFLDIDADSSFARNIYTNNRMSLNSNIPNKETVPLARNENSSNDSNKKFKLKISESSDSIQGFLPASSSNLSLTKSNIIASGNTNYLAHINKSHSNNAEYPSARTKIEPPNFLNKHKKNLSLKVSSLDNLYCLEKGPLTSVNHHTPDQSHKPFSPIASNIYFNTPKIDLHSDNPYPQTFPKLQNLDTTHSIPISSTNITKDEPIEPGLLKKPSFIFSSTPVNSLSDDTNEHNLALCESSQSIPVSNSEIGFSFKSVTGSAPSSIMISPNKSNRIKARVGRPGLNNIKKNTKTGKYSQPIEVQNTEKLQEFPSIQENKEMYDFSENERFDSKHSVGATLLLESLRKISKSDKLSPDLSISPNKYSNISSRYSTRPVSFSFAREDFTNEAPENISYSNPQLFNGQNHENPDREYLSRSRSNSKSSYASFNHNQPSIFLRKTNR